MARICAALLTSFALLCLFLAAAQPSGATSPQLVPGRPSALVITHYRGYDTDPISTVRLRDPAHISLYLTALNHLGIAPALPATCPHDNLRYDFLRFVYPNGHRWPVHVSLSGCLLVYSRLQRATGLSTPLTFRILNRSLRSWVEERN